MTTEQQAHLQHYIRRVAEAGIPLVSQADRSRLEERHLAPSLAGLELLPETGNVLDIGSGGGFPAIPLAILTPHLIWTLVESNSRKAAFLKRVSRETELDQRVTVLCSRVEELVHSHPPLPPREQGGIPDLREQGGIPDLREHGGIQDLREHGGMRFDCITARAVTELPLLVKWCRPLMNIDCVLLFWKGREWRQEAWPEELGLKLLTELNLADGSRLIKLFIEK